MCNVTGKMVSHLRKQEQTSPNLWKIESQLIQFADSCRYFFTKMSMLASNLKCVIFLLRLLVLSVEKNIILHNPRNERVKYISQNFYCFFLGSLL